VVDVGDYSDAVASLQREWESGRRWAGIQREHSAHDVIRLRRPAAADHALARDGARRLWELLGRGTPVRALDAITGDQAVELAQAGLQAIYLPGFLASPVPPMVRRINNAMLLAGRAAWPAPGARGTAPGRQRLVPVVADADAGLDRAPDAFELMTTMIEAGAAGVSFDDRLPWPQGHDHLGESVLVPTGEHIKALNAARLAADALDVPTLVIARTYAHETSLLTSDADERDHEFLTGERTADGCHRVRPGRYARVRRALAFAPHADLLWLETATPNLAEARAFADIIYSQYPGKLLGYSCSPAFDWARLDDAAVAKFHLELGAMGYRFQFTAPAARAENPRLAVPVG
jgi:isocitrate lyase